MGLAEGGIKDDGIGLVVADALQRFVLIARRDDAVAGAEEGGFDVAQFAGFAAGEHDQRLRMQICGFGSHKMVVVMGNVSCGIQVRQLPLGDFGLDRLVRAI